MRGLTSSAKMLTTAEKSIFVIIFWSEHVKEIANLYQGKFGAPGPKNAKMKKGGAIRPPVYHSLQKARVM